MVRNGKNSSDLVEKHFSIYFYVFIIIFKKKWILRDVRFTLLENSGSFFRI